MPRIGLPDLPDVVRRCLAADGPLQGRITRFRESDVQQEYARRIAVLLASSPDKVETTPASALIEAATGVGKTLGYLVPLMAYAAITGRRVAVATYTLDLLAQLSEHVPIVREALGEVLGRKMVTALDASIRMGRPEFVSPSRVQRLIDSGMYAPHSQILESLRTYAADGDGVLRLWGGTLPPGVSVEDVVLTASCSDEDGRVYRESTERARTARVVFCTQAALLIHASGAHNAVGTPDDDLGGLDAVVIDEADCLGSMSEALTSYYVSLFELRRSFIVSGATPGMIGHVAALEEAVTQASGESERAYLGPNAGNARQRLAELIAPVLRDIHKLQQQPGGAAAGDALAMSAASLERIRAALGGRGVWRLPYARATPSRSYAGLGLSDPEPATMLSLLWRKQGRSALTRVVLTSATLSAGGDANLGMFARSVGLNTSAPTHRGDLSGPLEPKRFGKLEFAFADPRAPHPYFRGRDEAMHNPEWLTYAARIIRRAHLAGGRTLVLAGSHAEAAALHEALRVRRVRALLQVAGAQSRQSCEAAFRADASAIWISATVWEGLDLPGMIQQLVIARMPNPRIQEGALGARRFMLSSLGYPHQRVEQIMQVIARTAAARKLKQGIGRPLRSARDAATVWFCDPRIGLPDELFEAMSEQGLELPAVNSRVLREVIPQRFQTRAVMSRASVSLYPEAKTWSPKAFA